MQCIVIDCASTCNICLYGCFCEYLLAGVWKFECRLSSYEFTIITRRMFGCKQSCYRCYVFTPRAYLGVSCQITCLQLVPVSGQAIKLRVYSSYLFVPGYQVTCIQILPVWGRRSRYVYTALTCLGAGNQVTCLQLVPVCARLSSYVYTALACLEIGNQITCIQLLPVWG